MKAKTTAKPKSDMDLMKLIAQFDTDDKCRATLEKLRWPDGVRCIRCESAKISRNHKRNQFECDSCGYHFSVTAGTIFHDSHLPLRKWFIATYLICESKKGISALQLKRTLGVAYKTAWYLCHRIREAVKDADTSLLSGICEVDETYVGGKAKSMHKKRLPKLNRGPATREILREFIKAKLADETELICTDQFQGYAGIGDENTAHATVDHFKHEYVGGVVHTNTMEGVWSLFKRSIIGSYHQISVKHLDRYLDELEFRFNNRNNPYLFRDALLRLIASSNLEYKQLTAE